MITLHAALSAQSWVCIGLGLLLWLGSRHDSRRARIAYLTGASLMAVAAWWLLLLPLRAGPDVSEWMGDYTTYVEDRDHFERYFGYSAVQFQSHLGGFVLNGLDRLLGRNGESPAQAFVWLSRLAGLAFLLELLWVAAADGWSPRALRYAGLALATPAALMFFGFRDLGYLCLSAAAFPLFALALERADPVSRLTGLAASAMTQGLHTALHGFGIVGLASLVAAAWTPREHNWATRLRHVAAIAAVGLATYLVWILLYIVVLTLPIVPGHAAGLILRPLTTPYVAEYRTVPALLSVSGAREVGAELVIAGVPILLLAAAGVRRDRDARRLLAAAAAPGLIFTTLYWPTQGIGLDMDLVVAGFPAVFAAAWYCARRSSWTGVALGTFAAAHALLWWVVRSDQFINRRI